MKVQLKILRNTLLFVFINILRTFFFFRNYYCNFASAFIINQTYPDYSNDIISAECVFSARTYLYRIFKLKEGCTPTEWREKKAENHSY